MSSGRAIFEEVNLVYNILLRIALGTLSQTINFVRTAHAEEEKKKELIIPKIERKRKFQAFYYLQVIRSEIPYGENDQITGASNFRRRR